MRKLILALLVAAPLLAGATTRQQAINTDGGGANFWLTNGTSGSATGSWNPGAAYKAYSSTLPDQTLTAGVVTFQVYGGNGTTGTANLYFGYRHGGVDTQLCTTTVVPPSGAAAQATCSIAGTGLVNGDQIWWYFTAASGSPYIAVGSSTYATWVQYNQVTPTTCPCGNDCGGASCGGVTNSVDGWSAGAATCNCGSSCNGIPAAPGSFACITAGGVACSWGATSGASYVLGRDGTTVYTGNSTSYTDLPSAGTHTYTVYGTGSCTPSNTGAYVTGTTNPLTATATTLGSKSGAIIGCW